MARCLTTTRTTTTRTTATRTMWASRQRLSPARPPTERPPTEPLRTELPRTELRGMESGDGAAPAGACPAGPRLVRGTGADAHPRPGRTAAGGVDRRHPDSLRVGRGGRRPFAAGRGRLRRPPGGAVRRGLASPACGTGRRPVPATLPCRGGRCRAGRRGRTLRPRGLVLADVRLAFRLGQWMVLVAATGRRLPRVGRGRDGGGDCGGGPASGRALSGARTSRPPRGDRRPGSGVRSAAPAALRLGSDAAGSGGRCLARRP